MKKITSMIILFLATVSIMTHLSFAAENNLIENIQMDFKSAETPNRLEVSFDLTESIDLSQGSADIIFEYFIGDQAEAVYRKDKTWAGYVNSYDKYPSGERKYSSGTGNQSFSDEVPAGTIYTSTRTGSSIDVALVTAVRVTVLRPDGSGEVIAVFDDQTTSAVERISAPILNVEKNTGIRLNSTAEVLPTDTVLIANEVIAGPLYEEASEMLADARDMIVFEIKLESNGVRTQPDGKVKISIPLPADFEQASLAVYRIDGEGEKTQFSVTQTTENNVNYATFETDHFSVFVLAKLDEYKYPYTIAYYRGSASQENLIGTVPGVVTFPENYELTAANIAADMGEAWLDAKKPVSGYYSGIVHGDYPIMSQDVSDNTVKVLYIVIYAANSDGTPTKTATETPKPDTILPDEFDSPISNEERHERYIGGSGNNNIRPEDNLTRAEMAMALFNLAADRTKETGEQKQVFIDVDAKAWYANAVAYLFDKGIVRGYEDKTYRPNAYITYAETVVLISRFNDLGAADGAFSDASETHWAYHYIVSAAQKGWAQGYEGEPFHPDGYVTRAEMIVMVNKALNRRVKREDLPPELHIWSDVPSDHWAYADIMEATHSHIYERESENDFETWIRIGE